MTALPWLALGGGAVVGAVGAASMVAARGDSGRGATMCRVVGSGLFALGSALAGAGGHALGARPERRSSRSMDLPHDELDLFEAFHWGERASRVEDLELPDSDAVYELGELVEVVYRASKGGEDAYWRHEFSRPYPRLTADRAGRLGPIIGGRAHVTPRGIED